MTCYICQKRPAPHIVDREEGNVSVCNLHAVEAERKGYRVKYFAHEDGE